jgi:hypothetical protein
MSLPLQTVKPDDWLTVNRNFNKIKTTLLGDGASPTFAGMTLTESVTLPFLTASRLTATDADKKLESVGSLTNWIAGTTNQITVTDDSDGTVTLATPQDIHTGAIPTFAGMILNGTTTIGLDMSSGTFATAVQNWPADPVIQVVGVTGIQIDTSNGNILFGTGDIVDTGTMNIFIGTSAGKNNDTTGASIQGKNNIGLGFNALKGAVGGNTGFHNIAIGAEALEVNDTGVNNLAIGGTALEDNTDGDNNVAIGRSALQKNTTGSSNIAVGTFALDAITTESFCTAVGQQALTKTTGTGNTGIGFSALLNLTSGTNNLAIGKQSLNFIVTGVDNVAIGNLAGFGVSGNSFSRNLLMGIDSGRALTTGSDNVFLGYKSGRRQTSNNDILIIDNQDRGSAAAEITDCLMCGVMDATPASQTFRLNVGDFIQGNPTHSDADGGGAMVHSWIREDGSGTPSTAATLTISHDGVVEDDQLAKIVLGVNTGAEVVDALAITSNLDVTAVKTKLTSIGGYAVKLTNTTGANTIQGQLVKADTATDDAVILTGTDEEECFGVFLDSGVADDAEAWVVVAGIADVAMEDDTAATHGNWVRTSITEAGYADATFLDPPGGGVAEIDRHMKEIGHCLESVVAGGGGTHILARCVLHFN